MKDFFISFNSRDRAWAEWIAWVLEEAGYSVVFQPWDFRPGSNFVLEMQSAATDTARTIAVLSNDYLGADFPQPEWAAAFAQDPKGKERKLIPFRINDCTPPGLLGPTVYVDLHNLSEDDARVAILGAFSERAKPSKQPAFPGSTTTTTTTTPAPESPSVRLVPNPVDYPGESHGASAITAIHLEQTATATVGARRLSATERIELNSKLNSLATQHFNMLVFALDPPNGLIPQMPAPQGERATYLLLWAESTNGCGLAAIVQLLKQLLGPTPAGVPAAGPTSRPAEQVQTKGGGDRPSHRRWWWLNVALVLLLMAGIAYIVWRMMPPEADNISFPLFVRDFRAASAAGTLDDFTRDHAKKQITWDAIVVEKASGGYRIIPTENELSHFKVLAKYDPANPIESLPNGATVKIEAIIDDITPLGPILKGLKVVTRSN